MNPLLLLGKPVFFEPNRVWRCYTGGLLLDEFTKGIPGKDQNFPEEWIASATRADNDEHQQSPDEGLSIVRGSNMLFADLLAAHPAAALGPASGAGGLGVLCKFLDSAIRLPIQCHPDRDFAKAHFASTYGKTESWIILATRSVANEEPYLLMGFKPDMTREILNRAVMQQDISAMCGCLHKIKPMPGEVYLIPGGMPHAIGPGLMLLEVQEPTDLVIQPERQIGNVTLSEKSIWAGLHPETALSCFKFPGATSDEMLRQCRLNPKPVKKTSAAQLESLIGPEHTNCFKVDKLSIHDSFTFKSAAPWHIAVVTAGRGIIREGKNETRIGRGDFFFVSNLVKSLDYSPEGKVPLELHLISGPF